MGSGSGGGPTGVWWKWGIDLSLPKPTPPLFITIPAALLIFATACGTGGGDNRPKSAEADESAENVSDAEATVTMEAEGCKSTIPRTWTSPQMTVALVPAEDVLLHFAAGTYRQGSGRQDLLDLGTRLSVAPPSFINLLYHEHARGEPNVITLSLDEPGRYWMVCFDDDDIDVVFPDVIVEM